MERMLRYSLERNRAIRLMYMTEDGGIRQVTAVVTTMDETQLSLYVIRPPQKIMLKKSAILSADYKKGDEGQE